MTRDTNNLCMIGGFVLLGAWMLTKTMILLLVGIGLIVKACWN